MRFVGRSNSLLSSSLAALVVAIPLLAPGAGPVTCPDGKRCHILTTCWCDACSKEYPGGTWTIEDDVCPVSTRPQGATEARDSGTSSTARKRLLRVLVRQRRRVGGDPCFPPGDPEYMTVALRTKPGAPGFRVVARLRAEKASPYP